MLIRQFFFIIILIITSSVTRTVSQTIFPPYGISQENLIEQINIKKAQHKLEFAFDIHKVLIHKIPIQQWHMILQYPHKFEFVKCLFDIQLMKTLSSMLWQLMLNAFSFHTLAYKDVTSGQLIAAFNNANKPELADFFTNIVNTQEVDPAMLQLIIDLKKAGYTLHVASNIAKPTFIKLKQQLEDLHTNIFAYFDKDAHGIEGKTIDFTLSNAEKPDPDYYAQYLTEYDPKKNKLIVFVDDKFVNIIPATEQGFVGIHFKNAQQLRNDLGTLGII